MNESARETSDETADTSPPVATLGPINEIRKVKDVVAYLAGNKTDLRKFLEERIAWPPDFFAISALILEESGAYHRIVSPPEEFPPVRWATARQEEGREWREYAEHLMSCSATSVRSEREPPEWLIDCLSSLESLCNLVLADLRDPEKSAWNEVRQLFRLFASADEACKGLGRVLDRPDPAVLFVRAANRYLLANGTLSRFHSDRVRVIPKLHTPQVGITLRSMSRHVGFVRAPVGLRWHIAQRLGARDDARLNLLVVPWPFEVRPSAFKVDGEAPQTPAMDARYFGAFEFEPTYDDPERVIEECVDEALAAGIGAVHGVVLPESALTQDEARGVAERLWTRDVQFLLTGVRDKRKNLARLMINFGGRTEHFDQHKHHRWCLDGPQIERYGLEWQLNPNRLWWENVDIVARQLNIVCSRDWLCLSHLICEDLARLEPVTPCVRTIAPNLIVALLQDGPQLEKRWPGRYASVLADDPGSSVLTVTSLGMALRSPPEKRVVALWKDPVRGTQELELPLDRRALLLTLTARHVDEFTADGRSGSVARLVLSDHCAVR